MEAKNCILLSGHKRLSHVPFRVSVSANYNALKPAQKTLFSNLLAVDIIQCHILSWVIEVHPKFDLRFTLGALLHTALIVDRE